MRPVLELAIPVRNGADFLADALESIRNQDIELPVVISDNASSDATPEIISEAVRAGMRIRVSRSTDFLPQATNVNRLVMLCDAEWIKILCHDDLLVPGVAGHLSQVVRDLPPRVGLLGNREGSLFANGFTFDGRRTATDDLTFHDGVSVSRSILCGGQRVGPPALTNATFRADQWKKTGVFDIRYAHFDTLFWARLLTACDYAYIDRTMTVKRIHPDQVQVSAQSALVTVAEYRFAWPELARELGAVLDLDRRSRLRVRLRGLGAAGSPLAVALLRKDPREALIAVLRLPPWWWPVLPVVTLRSYLRALDTFRSVQGHVPMELLHPRPPAPGAAE